MSTVTIVTELHTGQQRFDSQQGHGYFLFTTAPKLAMEPTQPFIQWVQGHFLRG